MDEKYEFPESRSQYSNCTIDGERMKEVTVYVYLEKNINMIENGN